MHVPDPDDILRLRDQHLPVSVKEVLGRCFRVLREQWTDTGPVTVDVTPFSQEAVAKAVAALRGRGWRVETLSDERLTLERS